MVEAVTGFLARDGKFYTDEALCRHHDAKLAIQHRFKNSIVQTGPFNEFIELVDAFADEIKEYILSREDIIKGESEPDDPDQRPITVEE